MEDATLAQRAAAGDQDAFAGLYERYAPALHDFCARLLRDSHAAADACHDTFLTAGARLHQLRDPSRVRPWLYAIARHTALRSLERSRRSEALEDHDVIPLADPSEPHDLVRHRELASLFDDAAAGLSDRDRTILELQLRHGLEGSDLADAMGMEPRASYVLVSRLRGQVERALGALLVARQGQGRCPDLDEVLADWDGRFSPLWRKRVGRHADGCETCSATRAAALSPAALLGAIPLVPPPADLRDRVLGGVQLVSHTGGPWPGKKRRARREFPPAEPSPHRRRAWWSAAAAAVALAFVAANLLVGSGPDDEEVAARGVSDVDELDAGDGSADGDDIDGGTSGAEASSGAATADGVGEGADEPVGEGTRQPFFTHPSKLRGPTGEASPAPGTDDGAGDPGGPTTAPGRQDEPSTTAATTGPTTATTGPTSTTTTSTTSTSTTTTAPPDTTGPSLGTLQVDPARIYSSVRGQGCGSQPTTARVSIEATDPSGVSSVVLSWGGPEPGTASMVRSGSAYVATIGDFAAPDLGSGRGAAVPLTVRADDAAGNRSSTTGSLTLIGC